MGQCDDLSRGISTLEDAISGGAEETKAERGRNTLDNLLKPMRDAVDKEKTATGEGKKAAVSDVNSFYDKGKGSEKNLRKETIDLTKALQADSDVHQYIRNMTPDEFGNARKEINDRFGGDQARMMERQYVNKLGDYENKLNDSGRMLPSIQDKISTARSRGEMSDADLNVMRGLEEYLSLNDNAFATGKARGTYNSLARKLGDDITQDIFATKIEDTITKLTTKIQDQSIASKMLKTTPTEDELKALEEIESGMRKMDADSMEFTNRLLGKVNASGLEEIRNASDVISELPTRTRSEIHSKAYAGMSKRRLGALGGLVGASGVVYFAAVMLPEKLNNLGQFGIVNSAEMSTLFAQFDKDTTAEQLIKLWFPYKNARQVAMDLWFESVNGYIDWMDTFYKIPIYGKWLEGTTFVGYSSAVSALGNYDTIMQTLENRHLAIRDSTAPHGWRQPTQAESKELNENDPEGFFKNDVDYINKNAPWTEKAGIIKEDGTELTPAQAMAIYYGQTGAYNKLGLQNSDANNPTTKQDIMEYGANNDKRGQKPAGGLPNAQGTTSVDDLYKQALLQRMKKYNESEADARKVVDRELQGLRAKGMDDIAALSQMTGKTVSGGGRGLSIGTSKTVDPYTKQAIKKISEGKGSTLDYNTKQNAVNNFVNDKSELDITKFKEETNDKMSLQEAAKTVGEAPVVAGFKGYVNDMKNDEEINKEDYQEMSNLDKEKTREAMREAYGCTGED